MTQTYHALNAELGLLGPDGEIQFEKDQEAARAYFLENVNQNTVFFHTLGEKMVYMMAEGYWSRETLDQYDFEDIKEVFKYAYSFKFRFPTFMGAFKFYTQYAQKTFDGERWLERYEDRVAMVALHLARGNKDTAQTYVEEIISGRFQPATPTFLNAGKADSGELVSCFLLRVEDNMESIGRAITNSLQLSKRGGGVALLLSNLRETGAPIKQVEGQSSGVLPVMKLLEDSFSYANQLGARQGAGAVYLHAHHPDIMAFLDTKRENADEKVRIKTLSLGVVVPDITVELARQGKDMALFSVYDIERKYEVAFADLDFTAKYQELLEDVSIRRTYIPAREFFQTIAELQFESGYPYIMYEDTVNAANPIPGKITMSNLCSEILQVATPSVFNEDGTYEIVGEDISCNLGSVNIAKVMEGGEVAGVAGIGIEALTAVSELSDIEAVPTVQLANAQGRSVGLGAMNLHGYLGSVGIEYGSEEALDFVDVFFAAMRFGALEASNHRCMLGGDPFPEFFESEYMDEELWEPYITEVVGQPKTEKVKELFEDIWLPEATDWAVLRDRVQDYGLYNRYLMAIPPTGSISYINGSTASIHPITSQVEIRKEGMTGRVYYPAPGLTNENRELFKDAFEIGPEKIIDTYAAATRHVDQGLSCTLFYPDTATTRDLVKAYLYAHDKGIKSLYYARVRQAALAGTEVEGCLSCAL